MELERETPEELRRRPLRSQRCELWGKEEPRGKPVSLPSCSRTCAWALFFMSGWQNMAECHCINDVSVGTAQNHLLCYVSQVWFSHCAMGVPKIGCYLWLKKTGLCKEGHFEAGFEAGTAAHGWHTTDQQGKKGNSMNSMTIYRSIESNLFSSSLI